MVERGFIKWVFLFILVCPIVWFIFLGEFTVPWTQVWSLDVLFYVFLANSMALFKFKKGELGAFRLDQVCWGQQLLLVIFLQLYANLC